MGFLILPDSPSRTRWLTPTERELATARIDEDTIDKGSQGGIFSGFNLALRDPRLYLLVLMQTLHLASNSFNSFFPTVVKALGFNDTITLVLIEFDVSLSTLHHTFSLRDAALLFSPDPMTHARNTASHVLQLRTAKKRSDLATYTVAPGAAFVPVVISPGGFVDKEFAQLLQQLKRKLPPGAYSFMIQRISTRLAHHRSKVVLMIEGGHS
jgi:hypothetical protein